MLHYLIELVLWMLVVFLTGCVIGYVLRRVAGTDTVVESVPAPVEIVESAPAPVVIVESAAALIESPVEIWLKPEASGVAPVQKTRRMARPKGLKAPRGGKPDNLRMIGGIGPKNEKVLHHQGFFHFDQIASWTPQHIGWLDDHLKFNGRIERQQWVRQASLLAEGKDKEFRREFGSGRRG